MPSEQTPLELDLIQQQRLWLAETFSDLLDIALAITQNLILGEDALSNAVYSMLTQIDRGKVRASQKGQFCAWSRQITRLQSRRIIGGGVTGKKRYNGDCPIDPAVSRLTQVKPPIRHTKPAATLSQLGG